MSIIIKYFKERSESWDFIIDTIEKSKEHKVCLVDLDKTEDSLLEKFKKKKIDYSEVYFVDCISSSIENTEDDANCHFVSEPYELDEIKEAIKVAIKKGYTLFIFDSLSDFIPYEYLLPVGEKFIYKFIKSISSALKKVNGKIYFTCDKEKVEEALIKETLPIFKKHI